MSCARALDLVHFGGVVVLLDPRAVVLVCPLAGDVLFLVGTSMLGKVGEWASGTVGAGSCPVEFGAVGGVDAATLALARAFTLA